MSNNKDFVVNGPVVIGKDTKVTVGSITSGDIDLATGNYFDDTLSANTTYTLSNAGDVQAFQLEVTGGAVGYDLGSAVYDNVSFSVSQDSRPYDMAFNSTGTTMFVIGTDSDNMYQYSLSTGFDVTTASYDSVAFSFNSQSTSTSGFAVKPDGTKVYVIGGTTAYQYDLSTAWDLTTMSYASKSFSLTTGTEGNPRGLAFSSNGIKMYMVGSDDDTVYQYTLSTAWDISTASYDSVSFSVSSQTAVPSDVEFNSDGTKMYILESGNDGVVLQYSLSTAYDVSTASYDNVSIPVGPGVGGYEGDAQGIAFSSDGTKMYVLGFQTDTIYQYSTATDATLTWPSSIEWAGGVAPSAPANGATDVYTFTTDDGGTTYTGVKSIDNAS